MSPTAQQPPYDFRENFAIRAGIMLISETGIISLLSIIGLFVVTLIRVCKMYMKHHVFDDGAPLLQPVSVFFLVAMLMDGIQAFGNALSIAWAFHGSIAAGPYCSMQGAVKQLGNTGVALFTIAISITTYINVVRSVPMTASQSNKIVGSVIGVILLFQLMIIMVPALTLDGYYDDVGFWCWINGRSRVTQRLRIATEYVYYWIAAALSIIFYGLIIRRYLREVNLGQRKIKDAIIMGWYPVAYVVQVLPISIVRFISFDYESLPHGYMILAGVLFAASGFINVLLWIITGRRFGFSKTALAEAQAGNRLVGQGEGTLPIHQAVPCSVLAENGGFPLSTVNALADLYSMTPNLYQINDPEYRYKSRDGNSIWGTNDSV